MRRSGLNWTLGPGELAGLGAGPEGNRNNRPRGVCAPEGDLFGSPDSLVMDLALDQITQRAHQREVLPVVAKSQRFDGPAPILLAASPDVGSKASGQRQGARQKQQRRSAHQGNATSIG